MKPSESVRVSEGIRWRRCVSDCHAWYCREIKVRRTNEHEMRVIIGCMLFYLLYSHQDPVLATEAASKQQRTQ